MKAMASALKGGAGGDNRRPRMTESALRASEVVDMATTLTGGFPRGLTSAGPDLTLPVSLTFERRYGGFRTFSIKVCVSSRRHTHFQHKTT